MKLFAFVVAASAVAASSAFAQSHTRVRQSDVIDSYTAFISDEDLHNSNGVRLTRPWQIIRQDRANVHDRNIQDSEDEMDGFFSDVSNRQALEEMLASGSMSNDARLMIVRGNCYINVQIYGRGETGDFIEVEVWK